MSRRASSLFSLVVLVSLVAVIRTSTSYANSVKKPPRAGSPYDLVNAVNALRASFGLTPYRISSILMSTAQAQADFLAATGSMTHSGPGGISFTERLLAAGYPLAGDLSAGGFRAENITGGDESMPAEAAVDRWTGDSLHLNTMVSQNLTEIGAGVAISNGRVYYVIDCALPTTDGLPPGLATSIANGSTVPENAVVIIPVSVSTPNTEGNVIHEVKPGQTLWQIAITYEVKIDDIKRLNNLSDNFIYPGNNLLIKTGVILPTASPTETPTQRVTSTSTGLPTSTSLAHSAAMTSTPNVASSKAMPNNATVMKVVIGIIALALLGGGIFAWLGSSKKE
jgi:uncharacterized protein YkwD/LysM repeat protein